MKSKGWIAEPCKKIYCAEKVTKEHHRQYTHCELGCFHRGVNVDLVLWNVMLCVWVSGSCKFWRNMTTACSVMHHHIPEDQNPQFIGHE
jgi:hypothetical protein